MNDEEQQIDEVKMRREIREKIDEEIIGTESKKRIR